MVVDSSLVHRFFAWGVLGLEGFLGAFERWFRLFDYNRLIEVFIELLCRFNTLPLELFVQSVAFVAAFSQHGARLNSSERWWDAKAHALSGVIGELWLGAGCHFLVAFPSLNACCHGSFVLTLPMLLKVVYTDIADVTHVWWPFYDTLSSIDWKIILRAPSFPCKVLFEICIGLTKHYDWPKRVFILGHVAIFGNVHFLDTLDHRRRINQKRKLMLTCLPITVFVSDQGN